MNQNSLPLLPLRDVVVFPHMVIPLFVGRPKSIKALEAAMEAGKSIMLVAQKNGSKDDPTADDIQVRDPDITNEIGDPEIGNNARSADGDGIIVR